MSVFDEVRRLVSAREVVELNGLHPSRSGYICCPLHHEKTASMKLYPNGSWYCFGCNRGGSSIDLVVALYDLPPIDAVKKINTDFNLGLNLERRDPTPQEREHVQQRRKVANTYQAFQTWRSNMIRQLNATYRTAHLALISDATLDKFTDAEVLAIKWQPAIEYLSDCLMFGDMEQQMTVFRQRKEVENLCQKILICSQKCSQTKPDVA